MLGFFGVQVFLIASNVLLGWFIHSQAVMRGAGGTEMPMVVDKFVRTWFFLMLFYPIFYLSPYLSSPFLLAYYITYVDGSEKVRARMNTWARGWRVWKLITGYFSMTRVIKEAELEDEQQYIFGFHPHGILPVGTMAALLSTAVDDDMWSGRKMRVLAASFCFYIPFYRDVILLGGVVDAARYNAKRVLSRGYSLALVPGGATEALHSTPQQDVVYLKNRRGFIKLALEHGAHLVPCYSFGESETYTQAVDTDTTRFLKHHWQRLFGISLPILTSVFPKAVTITPVIGKPIVVNKVADPSKEQIQELLDLYEMELKALYGRHAEALNNVKGKNELKVI